MAGECLLAFYCSGTSLFLEKLFLINTLHFWIGVKNIGGNSFSNRFHQAFGDLHPEIGSASCSKNYSHVAVRNAAVARHTSVADGVTATLTWTALQLERLHPPAWSSLDWRRTSYS